MGEVTNRSHSIANTSKFTQQCNMVHALFFLQFTGYDQPVQRSHSSENAIDWLG